MNAIDYTYKCWLDTINPGKLKDTLGKLLTVSGFGVCGEAHKYFEPEGYSKVWLLSESHLAIHTYTDDNRTALCLSSCIEEYYKRFSSLIEKTDLNPKNCIHIVGVPDKGWRVNLVPADEQAWGMMTSMRIDFCNPNKIRSGESIANYTRELCELIEMKRYGEPQIPFFGEDQRVSGYSLNQFIETSNVTGHFRNENDRIYMDVFSCKEYDPELAVDFTKKYFNGVKSEYLVLNR